jgi:hypothetical protein
MWKFFEKNKSTCDWHVLCCAAPVGAAATGPAACTHSQHYDSAPHPAFSTPTPDRCCACSRCSDLGLLRAQLLEEVEAPYKAKCETIAKVGCRTAQHSQFPTKPIAKVI